MPFDDALIGDGNDFDPRTAMESLIRQNSAEPLPDTLDPRMLNTRLARKLNQPAPEPEPVDVRPAAKPAPDFSAQAVEPTTPNANLDFSDQAVPPAAVNPAATPAAPGISSTVGTYATEFGKGVAEGAKNMGASALKGTAAVGIPTRADTTLLDELATAKDITPSGRAKLMGRVLRDVSDRGLQMDYNAALRRITQGADPAAEIEALRPKFEANNKSATEPVTEKKLYKAGQAVEDFGKEALAPAPGFENSWTRDIGSGAGSMAAGIAASMIPGIGPTVAGSLFTAAGMGEAAEKAVKGGADNDQIRRATMLGGVAGATDLVDALIPMLGSTGRALGFLKRVGIAAVKGAIMEGGQEGVQQLMQNAIAKGIYKPDQDMFEDVPRSVAVAAILGGAGGGISGAASRGRDAGAPGLPPPGGGAAPGTGPTSGGPSSPEDIADFVRKAREGNPENPETRQQDAQNATPDPATMSEAERQQAYTASRESHGGASEAEILKAAGLDPATMDEQERIDAVIKAAKTADATSSADSTADAKPGASEPQEDESSHLRYAVLREYGYSDEDIDGMSSRQRKREYMDAIAEGIEPGKAMSKYKKRAPKAAEPTAAPEAGVDWGERLNLKDKTDQQLNELIAGVKAHVARFEATINDPIDSKRHPKETIDHYAEQVRSGREGIAAAEKELANRAKKPEASTTGLPEAFSGMGKDIGESLRKHLWARVEAGEESEGNGLGKSAMLQGAKMLRERGGLKTREEFDAYANEQAEIEHGAPDFQQRMRALVAKYAPKQDDTGQNVPESRATLKAQQNQLIAGERVAQMFPTGTKEMPLPPGMERVETERGIFHFDPKKADADTIKKVSAEGRENELLGLGSFSKADIAARQGEENVTIVERTPDGTEVRAAVGTPSTVEQQRAEMEKGKSAGNTVSIEHPQQTLDGRNGKGTKAEPIDIKSARDVERTAKAGATDYTPAQGEANNRQIGHAKWNGLPVSLEVAKGGVRKMVNPETQEPVEVTHAGAAYGYFPGTIGADKMHVDVYMGEHPESPHVFVIDEIDRDTKKFRQHKVMAGFTSERDAFAAYVGTSTKGPDTVGSITAMSVTELKAWLDSGETTKALKPASPDPDKTDEAGPASTEAAESGSAVPKGSPDASLGGGGGVRPEATTPKDRGGSSAPAKKVVDEPLSLLQFIADKGGLAPHAELNALGLAGDYRVQIPGRKGFFGLIKATGESIDNMREAAEEAGYFRGDHNKTSTIRDFLDAVDTELRGGVHRAEGEEDKKSKRERTSQSESSAAARDKALAENVAAIQAEYTELPEGLAEQAATIMADEMLDLDSAVEMAAVRAVNEDTDYQITENDITATYGEGAIDALQTRSTSGDGGAVAPASSEEQQPDQGKEAVADGAPDEGARPESGESSVPAEDRTGEAAPDRQLDDTAGAEPDAAGDAGGAAVEGSADAAKDTDNADWWHRELTPQGRQDALDATGISANKQIRWHYLTKEQQDRLSAFRAEEAPDGVQAPVHAGDAPAGAEDVQPAEPVGRTGSVREREGSGSEQAVPRADGERPEGSGRVSEGARGKRSDRTGDGGDARLSEARADDAADGRARRNERASAHVEGENFVIEPGALDEGRGQKQKARDNIKAIETLTLIESESRPATAAEQADLAKYVGWGGIKNIFPDEQGKFGSGFEELGAKLKDLLLDVEYTTARRSIQYAHYTAEDVVRSMWSAVEKMGFKGGQVFEPGMGVGNFAGMMPQDLAANTHYQGVELDHVTARIAKLLYPKYGIRQDDFTKTRLPENSYDLVIGNPPFADVAIKSDPKYKQGFLLHDYFFAKSLDAVRPGGLLAFVTSAGTMNKIDPSAREYLADRADFVGGIRLPGDAFKKNAGTEVTTDIIFLRKRMPGDVPGDRRWTETKKVTLPGPTGTSTKGNMNAWFAEHGDMVLGEEGFFDKLYEGRYAVRSRVAANGQPGSDLRADLAKAIKNLPADVMSPWQDVNTEQHQHDFDTTEKKEGTYYVGPDGSLHQVNNGVGQKVGQRGKGVENGRTAADMERIKGLIPVRDALRQVYAFDLKGDTGNAERARATLNKSYDDFVAKFGPINKAVIQTRRPNVIQMEAARAEAREEARYADATFREGTFDATDMLDAKVPMSVIARERQKMREDYAARHLNFDQGDFDIDEVPDVIIDKRPNVDPFMDDPESYRLRAIERYDEGTGQGHKSPVFFENIITREITPKISSVHDGLLYSLNQHGRVNIPAIAELTKKSDAQVIEELGEQVFKVPGTKDAFQTRDEYLSGNVRKKLELAQRAADRNPEFRRNVAALEANQPMPLAPSQIHASLGMPWIPQAEIEKFGMQELGLEKLRVRYTPALASWSVSGDTDSVAARSTWGTEQKRAPIIIQSALNRQNIKVYDEIYVDGKKSSVLNVAKTEAANDKMAAIKEKFSGWLWADQERADRLAAYYNENYNNLVVREYDGSYLTTPGIASHWSWRPHQKRVIARVIQSGNTYIAHAVGGGKTSEYIGAIMEMRRLGLVRKPMVAVPNHMLAQFTKEWYEQYPTARLAIADDKRFHTDKRKQFVANVALDDLDAIIITHSSFGMIPVSAEFENGIINREISQYRQVLAEIKNDGDSRITRSRIEKQIERLEQRLVSRKGRKDSTFTFEEMGVDHLTIDEAHLFRKLDFTTAMSNLKGVSPEGSQMAWDLYVKSLYLNSVRPGRSLVLGSGTPITNTMAELYTLSRYMQPEVLAERGLEKFDAWAGAFGESVSELEQDAAGNYKPVSRFAKFVNVAELSAMVRQVMDVVTSKQLEQYVTRPQVQGGKRQMVLAEKSRELVRFQENLAKRMIAIQKRKGPPAKGDDIMLSVINDGRHAAIDMRLAGGDASNIPSKLELMADNVYRIWEESKRQKFHKVAKEGGYEVKPAMTGPATQLVFINLGLSGARGFSVPDYLRAELHRRGVPRNEIAYIYDYKSATAKQRLFNDMNEGKVRILMGSVAKMGVGTNVQRRLLAIHNMDPLWYPADDEQRNGRGIRQGNMNPEIGIWDYSTKGTYDSTMWGMMEKKARFIQGFFEGDPSLRDMDDLGEASQYEQAKALTTNDPRLIRFTELKQDLERANRRKTAFESDVYNTRQNRQKAAAQIEHYTQRVEDTKKDIKQRTDTRADAFKGTVGKETFDKRADFGVALFDRIGEVEDSGSLKGGIKVASVGGFDIYATAHKSNLIKDHTNVDVFMSLNGNATREVSFDTSSLGTVRSIESILHGFESDLAEYQERLAKASKFFKDSETKANAKFEGAADIAALKQQVDDLAAELAKAPAEAVSTEMDEEGPALAELSEMQAVMTPLANEKHAEISEMLTAIVRAVAGDIPKVEFHKGLIPVKPPPGYPADMKPVAAGQYRLGAAIIRLALTMNAEQMASTAFHESYHHIEDRLQTTEEIKLMHRETPRMREWIKGKTGMTDAQVDGLGGFEVRAIAFQTYAGERVANKDAGKGLHIGVRRWFERLMDLLQRIRNGLKGLGFNTYKDVFDDAFTGKMATRPDRGTGGIHTEEDLSALSDLYGAVADRVSNKFGERATELRVKLQDRFIRVRHAQASVGGVRTSLNTYQAESLMPGRTGQRLETLEKEKFEPLVEAMDERGIGLEEMSDYLYAKHAPERNAAMDAINHPNLQGTGGRDLRGRGSGMSDDEAQAIMDRITAAGRMADFQDVEAMVRDIQQGTIDTLVAYGLISEETATAWASQYDHYVPLQGFDEAFEDEVANMARGMGMDTRARESKQAFGRLSKAAGPLPYIMMQAELAIVRGEKNKVGNTFLRFVNAHPDPRRWSVNRPKMVKTIDPRTGLVTMVADNQWHNDPNVFVTKVGGQRVIIRLEGNEGLQLARALKNMGVENLNEFLRFMRAITVTMARLSTQWNPNFVVPNLVRDLGEAYINLQEQDQAHFVKQFTKHLIPAIGGSFQALRGSTGGRYAAAFREYDAAGGRVRFFGLDNAVDVEKNIRRQMRRLQGGPVATIQEAGKKLADGFDTVNSSMENATRLAAYMAARDVGMSIPDSANLALNLTVNFTKKGELGSAINSLWMFANATFQGGRRTFSALKNKNVRRATYALIGLGALSAMLGYGAGGDDDSGESYYSKVPQWERDKNLIIMWPKGYGRDGGYIKLPLPFLFGAFKVLGDRLVGVMFGKDKPLDAMGSVIKAVLDGLSPLGEEGGTTLSPKALLPSVFRPAVHIMDNQNWNGRQIYPARDFEKNKPDSEQFFSTTPQYAKSGARALNKATGGSPYKSGWADVHPGSIQHVLESLTGGLGKFISDVSGTADRAWKGEAFDATKAPIARRFVGSANTEQSDASRYYADREEARKNGGEAIKNARKDRAKGVNVSEAESFLANNQNSIRGEQIFKNAEDAMKPLRDQKSRLEAGDSFSDEQRTQVESIKTRMREIQNRARKQYRELRGAQ